MSYLNEIGDPKTLQHLDKHYMVTRPNDHVAPFSYPKQLPVVLKENTSGKGREIRLRVGDDLKNVKKGYLRKPNRSGVQNLTSGINEFKFNGAKPAQSINHVFPNGDPAGCISIHLWLRYYGLLALTIGLNLRWKKMLCRGGLQRGEVILRKHNPR